MSGPPYERTITEIAFRRAEFKRDATVRPRFRTHHHGAGRRGHSFTSEPLTHEWRGRQIARTILGTAPAEVVARLSHGAVIFCPEIRRFVCALYWTPHAK